jgi:hypothetical protein
MLRMPQRSVTRFFIPLIDVLTLLFCVFLIMPMAQPGAGGAERPATLEGQVQQLVEQTRRDADALAKLRAEMDALRQSKGRDLAQKLQIVILSLRKDGKLYGPDGLEIAGPDDAELRVKRDRNRKGEDQELLYLVRFENVLTRERREQIDGWFTGQTVKYDLVQ